MEIISQYNWTSEGGARLKYIKIDGDTLKGIPVALQFGYKEAWDGAETSLGTFSDPSNKF